MHNLVTCSGRPPSHPFGIGRTKLAPRLVNSSLFGRATFTGLISLKVAIGITVLDGLGDSVGFDPRLPVQVRDGAGHLEDPVVKAIPKPHNGYCN